MRQAVFVLLVVAVTASAGGFSYWIFEVNKAGPSSSAVDSEPQAQPNDSEPEPQPRPEKTVVDRTTTLIPPQTWSLPSASMPYCDQRYCYSASSAFKVLPFFVDFSKLNATVVGEVRFFLSSSVAANPLRKIAFSGILVLDQNNYNIFLANGEFSHIVNLPGNRTFTFSQKLSGIYYFILMNGWLYSDIDGESVEASIEANIKWQELITSP